MLQDTEKVLVQLLKKIPIFDGLPPTQVRRLLGICEHRGLAAEARLCESDTPSDEMYVLLTGQLSVVTSEGLQVATILPVTTVGEVGVITGQPRSATVEVVQDARILVIRKSHFDALLGQDRPMCARIFRNVIHILSAKLVNDNIHLRDYQIEKTRYEGRLITLFKQVQHQKRRTELLLDFLDEQGIASPVEAARYVGNRIREKSLDQESSEEDQAE